jgi:hypothetical protein
MTRLTIICIGILMLASVSSAEIDSTSIVGAWLFDEGKGETAKDSSGNGKDGEIVGGAKWVSGQFGNAIELNGQDAWVNVPEIGPLEEITILIWFNSTGRVGQWRCFFNHDSWSQGFVHYQFRPDNKMEFCIHSNANGGRHQGFEGSSFTADASILNQWHHVAVAYNSKEGKVRVYFDGELDLENDWGALPGTFAPGRIGSWDGGGREWQGMFDEVLLFNVSLEEDDIRNLMDKGLMVVLNVDLTGRLTTTWANVRDQK